MKRTGLMGLWRRRLPPVTLVSKLWLPRSSSSRTEACGIRVDGAYDLPHSATLHVSIAEAMAADAHIFVRNLDELIAYVGNTGTSYADIEDAFNLIKSTEEWIDAQWNQAWINRVRAAYMQSLNISGGYYAYF